MRKVIFILGFTIIGSLAIVYASVPVKGYYRKDGTWVPPHTRSNPNGTTRDNYSVKPNINPQTGKPGRKNP